MQKNECCHGEDYTLKTAATQEAKLRNKILKVCVDAEKQSEENEEQLRY